MSQTFFCLLIESYFNLFKIKIGVLEFFKRDFELCKLFILCQIQQNRVISQY